MKAERTETGSRSLAGPWRFALDAADAGVADRWWERALAARVTLPGDLAGQGIGDDVTLATKWIGSVFDPSYFTAPEYAKYREPGNLKLPFWLQPDKHYAGAAWYQRDIEIPDEWAAKRVVLTLERAHWETRVWLDGREIGRDDSLSTPHVYELGERLAVGRRVLTVRVDNRYLVAIGPNSHSVTDHTQGNWNGLIGRLELSATEVSWIDELRVFPEAALRAVVIRGRVGGAEKLPAGSVVRLTQASGGCHDLPGGRGGACSPSALCDGEEHETHNGSSMPLNALGERVPPRAECMTTSSATESLDVAISREGAFEARYALRADAALWDEFSPALHSVTATLPNGETRMVRFGLRDVSTEGTQFTLNGRRIFLRGTLECAIFPKSGHPPTDVESWKRILRIARAHGLNHVRFHSWCPPEAAFIAGDELGFYFQIEAASWPNQGATVGDGGAVDAWIVRESERIVRAYGNHPSFLFMAAGNEPDGKNSAGWLGEWVERMKAADGRRLYTCTAGWPELPANQYHVDHRPRMHQWLDHLKSRINALPPETRTDYRAHIAARAVPVVSHEIGQWCVYPNFEEIEKYTGYLKPKNFEIFRETLAEHGLADQAAAFLHASGKLQALCYKEEIESALRTPGMGGFQLLDLHDFPGQGTALVGVLDAFWEEKGYITAAEYRRFAGATVPLVRLEKRVFRAEESFTAEVEVTHFGAAAISGAETSWRLVAEEGNVIARGTLPVRDVPIGSATALGHVSVELAAVTRATRATFVVEIWAGGDRVAESEASPQPQLEPEGAIGANDWDVWIYPALAEARVPAGVILASELDAAALAALENGGTVVLSIAPERVAPDAKRGKVELGFSSIFWNTAWTNQQAPHTLGILSDPLHAAFAKFPTEAHSNWQWWYPVMRAGALILDELPRELRPIVQVIDDWFTNRKLGLVFEARVGRGKLLVSSIALQEAEDAVCHQLWASLLGYAGSAAFRPQVAVTVEQVRGLMR